MIAVDAIEGFKVLDQNVGERVRALEEWRKYVGQRLAEMHADAKQTRAILASIERTLSRIQWLVLGMLIMAFSGNSGLLKYIIALL